MLVFARSRLVLLSVPKTGTTALETVLAEDADIVLRNPPQVKHMTLRGWQARIAPLLPSGGAPYRVAAVVRDPVDRLRSWYRYRHRDDLVGRPASTRGMDFEAFVAAVMQPGERAPFARIGSQADFLSDDQGRVAADLIYPYEAIEALADFMAGAVGHAITLPRVNVSPPVEAGLSPETEARLRAHLARDCALHAEALGRHAVR